MISNLYYDIASLQHSLPPQEQQLSLVLLVQEASRQSSADLNKIKLYDFTVMESEENRENLH